MSLQPIPGSGAERDACAIVAFIDKRGHDSHANIVRTVEALRQMGHRSGDIDGEGDGCGLSVDLPRHIWAQRLASLGLSPQLAESDHFFVGHFLLPAAHRGEANHIIERGRKLLADSGLDLLAEVAGKTNDAELGPRARADAPLFWQVAGMVPAAEGRTDGHCLFQTQLAIEHQLPELHTASVSTDTVIYKLQGAPELLPRVFPELRDPEMRSVMTMGHGRYSTNTLPTVARSQPFSLLGHNGEINTIERLRGIGRSLGIEPVPGGSDSQDLNRIIEGLIHLHGLDPIEALEMVFPPIPSEVRYYPPALRDLYAFYRWFFPCSAQGPAAVLARVGDLCLGSVDALGLRPLWFGESDYTYFLSSEKGVVDLAHTIGDPCPLAPGEKIAIRGGRGKPAEVMAYGAIQERLARLFVSRGRAPLTLSSLQRGLPAVADDSKPTEKPPTPADIERLSTPAALVAFGWRQYDQTIRRQEATTGDEVIGSLGYTGPLAALAPEALPNLADYCKENVAVVTNPALDRERETEHFSTAVVLGRRPEFGDEQAAAPLGLELASPLLLGAADLGGILSLAQCRQLGRQHGNPLMEDILDFFTCGQRHPGLVQRLDASFVPSGGLDTRLAALADEATSAIAAGAVLLILDDTASFDDGRVFIDPTLLMASLHETLIKAGLRRQASLIVHSGAIRNLHDLMLVLGVGADAVHPYLLWRTAISFAGAEQDGALAIARTLAVLQQGMEKVMSTMGIHEIGGYGRIFTAIGLRNRLARTLGITNFCGSDNFGLGLAELEAMASRRYATAHLTTATPSYREPDPNLKVGRIIREAALGKTSFRQMAEDLASLGEGQPTAIRHLLRIEAAGPVQRLAAAEVDLSVGDHDLPLVIAAMSFGSQGESSFRTYAAAAVKANIVCLNGEGGEIPDMLGRYRKNRSQQVASGRFGVFMDFLNSTAYLEIKIGQGAKPGEGGHLPGSKVTAMVAQARHCKVGTTLISPANHHDIYSIEDLAQVITELKTANPAARISVKIPVTSGVGTIGVGIAKAGADIINISGYEGGTGAAREHAKRFVGLPTEIGVSEAHRALVASGLRHRVEIWADGGMRSGNDVLKLILLGANRVGFGTVALMAIGCIACRQCHLDRCPRGISTQIQTKEEAAARGIKGFVPRLVKEETDNLARLLLAIGDELRMRAADLGVRRVQDLVGKSDLLAQYRLRERLDVSELLRRAEPYAEPGPTPRPRIIKKPLNHLTRLISDLAMARFAEGETTVHFVEEGVRSTDRAVGTYLAGALAREALGRPGKGPEALIRLGASVPGNGLCAFNRAGVEVIVEGGSQDGAVKGSMGGLLGVFKGQNLLGRHIDGSTGKGFAYGAIGGLFMVQNMADSRACVRLSGADVVFGGRIVGPVRDELGNIASRAHLKGFAFEYMTGGRAVVLGDPGPWICAGMTGGVIYQCLYPEYGFGRDSILRRLSQSAKVAIVALDPQGLADIHELLGRYIAELGRGLQHEEAGAVAAILGEAGQRFCMIKPRPARPAVAADWAE